MNILLTGCSQGVGLQTCKTLLENNHHVYGISRTTNDQLSTLTKNYPNHFHHLPFDLLHTDRIKIDIFSTWIPNSIPLHAFINNAALAYDDLITNMQPEPLEKMFQVNVFSPFLITKYVIRNMLFNRISGSVVHLSSISVHTGYKGLAMYAATKGALEAFSKNTAREWGARGIRSNCIVAGFMETNMSSALGADQKNKIYNRTALKKATEIQSVVDTVTFLIGQGSSSITGQNIHVDSGTI